MRGIRFSTEPTFAALPAVAKVVRIVGWVLVIAGVVALGAGLANFELAALRIAALIGLLVALGGLVTITLGEILEVALAIERNTRPLGVAPAEAPEVAPGSGGGASEGPGGA
jgi:hypothetical protein